MIIKIILILAAIFAIGLITVLQTKSSIIPKIEESIAYAETQPITNEQKMSLVVDIVYQEIIPLAQIYFTKTRIEKMAESTFKRIKEYYLAKVAEKDKK